MRLSVSGKGLAFGYGGDAVIVLAAINALLFAEQSLWAWCFSATGKIGRAVPAAVLGAIVNATVSYFMTRHLGLIGPLIGSTVGFVTVGLWALPWLLRRTFGTPPAAFLRAAAVPFAVGGVAACGLRMLTLNHEPATWLGLVAAMSPSSRRWRWPPPGAALVLLTSEDRTLWRQRLGALRGGTVS